MLAENLADRFCQPTGPVADVLQKKIACAGSLVIVAFAAEVDAVSSERTDFEVKADSRSVASCAAARTHAPPKIAGADHTGDKVREI